MEADQIKKAVQEKYAEIARSGASCCSRNSECCSPGGSQLIQLVDYAELKESVVQEANLGLGCGMPTQAAAFHLGETVLDLGSGAGVDVFLAAQAVGPRGHVIGVDMTPEMIERARQNAARGGFTNVEFRPGDIENLPVESGSVDVVLSNCVINLAPNKARVYAEIFRVLKPGGRFSISDMVTYGAVPAQIRSDMALWAGCVSGAVDLQDYLGLIAAAGFERVQINRRADYDYLKGQDYGLASVTLEGYKPA